MYFLVYNHFMKVVIIGKGLMLANLILGAVDAGAEIVGVLRYEQTCMNSFKQLLKDIFNPEPELTLIKQLGLKQLKFKSVNSEDFRKFLVRSNVDIVFVGTWKELIKKETFIIPKIGMINVHPSLLPKYRGPNPYIQTILQGEKFSGVTLHLIDEKYDGGAILSQQKVEILETDTSKELREKSVAAARGLVSELLVDLNNKIITPIAQSEKNSTYFPNITGNEKMLDFLVQTSAEVFRTVKALHPFLPCYITYKDKFFIVNPYRVDILNNSSNMVKGTIIAKDSKSCSLTIVCADGVPVRFESLKLYRGGWFTKFYIENFISLDHGQA